MMYMLTGDEKFKKESMAFGASLTNQKKKEDAERVKEGLRPLKRRKNKKSLCTSRKDKTKTMKRRGA